VIAAANSDFIPSFAIPRDKKKKRGRSKEKDRGEGKGGKSSIASAIDIRGRG